MILHIYAKIKALNWKPDAESVIQLEADLRPSEVQQLAAFGGTTLQVQLLKQQPDMFDDNPIEQQPGLFDDVDLPEATGPTCTKCGGDLEDLVCLACGQRHRMPSSDVAKPEPVLCELPARFRLTATSLGDDIRSIDVCEAHMDAADPNHEAEIDDAPEGATCRWELTPEEIAVRREEEADPEAAEHEAEPDTMESELMGGAEDITGAAR